MSDRRDKNYKIGMWSLYGTLGGWFVIGTLISIVTNGIVSYLTDLAKDLLPLIVGLLLFAIITYIAGLISDQLVPIASGIYILGLIFYLGHSWPLTIAVAVFINLYFLIDLKFEDEQQATNWMKGFLGFVVFYIVISL